MENKDYCCPVCGKDLKYIIMDGWHRLTCNNCGMITGRYSEKDELEKELKNFES